ncbi:discoidin domain-containing protein [Photobacterium sp. OFAV2-7]|uniref:discoidin domain-containing protein n=1 Tax=Photobacterium sp. OFAV2-7 TaxID=2917748 RepID=UPI001EF4CBFC|nr:discoidin domain-containing protein [Photobacterium sp. OFAV2-7]MCG7585958.1 family 16 glycosylhydrolase [Photobacterium sp. OFAV2-7]
MRLKYSAVALAIFGTFLSLPSHAKTLVWSDEFDGNKIDKSVWTYDVGNSGWGNSELQTYTDDSNNAYVEDGKLIIQATKDEEGNFNSARLKSLGRLSYKYGTIEARIKLPDLDAGLWPAFWQLGSDFGQSGWPACGELDILEAGMAEALNEGTVNSKVSGAFHWWHESESYTGQADYGQTKNLIDDFELNSDMQDYHIYGMTWTPDSIVMWIDDEANEIISLSTSDENGIEQAAFDEFRQHNFLILNMAVGGHFPEIYDKADVTAPMPAKMYVDYVRIYDNDASDYSTEISTSSDTAKSGDLGVYSEGSHISETLQLGSDTELYVWNNMTAVSNSGAAEGSNLLDFEIAADDWYGMGFNMNYDLNMMNYSNGHLNFQMKTINTDTIGIGIASTGGGDAWVDLVNDGESYGLKRDGQWHQVSIPLSKFGIDFYTVSQTFMIRGGAPSEAFELSIDDIYFTESADKITPSGNFTLYSETVIADYTFDLGTNGNLYVWENTLTDTTQSPFEGDESMSYSSSGAGWFGLAFTSDYYYDLSAYESGSLNFALKTTSNTTFSIGMKSGSVSDIGQKWIEFTNGSDPYNFARDGEWHEISIPLSDISDEVDLANVIQLFELLGTNGDISDIEIDNIYFSEGSEAASISATSEFQSATLAIDGDGGTRWESEHGVDNVSLTYDLGAKQSITSVEIDWETANAASYALLGSVDGQNWTNIATYTALDSGERTDVISVDSDYRYLKIDCSERNTIYGYSIWEIRVN